MRNLFKTEPTLEELREREEQRGVELSIAEKEAMIEKLKAQGRHWKEFSNNGTKSGINFDRIRAWLRGNK